MKRVFAWLLTLALLIGLLPNIALAADTVTVTVTMDTQVVAEDASHYGLTALPETATVTVPKDSTVDAVLRQWASDQSVSVAIESSAYGPYLTAIGDFGAFGTNAFNVLCAAAGYTPAGSGDVFQYAGWTYSIDGTGGLGLGNDTISGGETIDFRYGLYMASGTWEQVDHVFLDAYNTLAGHIAEGDAAARGDFNEAQWETLQTALGAAKSEKSAIDLTAAGMWMNYFAEKQTALWGPGSPTDKLQKADLALKNAVNKVVTPAEITFSENDVELPLNQSYTIVPTVGPEGASQEVTYEAFLGDTAFSVSDMGTITPTATNNLCWVKVACKDNAGVFAYFRFKVVEARYETVDSTAKTTALLESIAASYTGMSSEWIVMDMAAYEDVVPASASKSSAEAKKAYINSVIDALTGSSVGETTYAKAIIALQSIGADPQKIYPHKSSTFISAAAGLSGLAEHDPSAWVAPYTLAALNQGDYGTDALEQEIIAAVLANQAGDGSWSEWGDSIQTTANVIAGLAFYYGTNSTVTTALDKAIAYLSAAQKADGSFDAYGTGPDANTAAMVIIALSALGIDPDGDARFIKGGVSALDALAAFGLADNSGFGYTDNTEFNPSATEQGFRALIAAKAVKDRGTAFNIYDFSANEVEPARYTTSGGGGGSRPSASDEKITVSFALKTHEESWIDAREVKVSKGSSVGELFVQVLEEEDRLSYVNQEGYISSVTKGGKTLAARDLGKNSGWKYMVNGVSPAVGMNDKKLSDGDEVVWYYVVDYTKDKNWNENGPAGDGETTEKEGEKPFATDFSDVDSHWGAKAIAFCAEKGLMKGTGEGAFSPNMTASRAMIVTVLHALEKTPAPDTGNAFADVASGEWYTNAVLWASKNGIVSGYNGNFMPNADVTREQLAVMLWRYERAKGRAADMADEDKLQQFADAGEVSPWAREAISWACGVGLLRGGDGRIMPQKTATRAEIAQVFFNLLSDTRS